MADTEQIEGLPEGAVVGPQLQAKDDNSQIEGLPEGAQVGPHLQTVDDLKKDQKFMSSTPADQQRQLMRVSPEFKAMKSEDQALYLANLTNQPTTAQPVSMWEPTSTPPKFTTTPKESPKGESFMESMGTGAPAYAPSEQTWGAPKPKEMTELPQKAYEVGAEMGEQVATSGGAPAYAQKAPLGTKAPDAVAGAARAIGGNVGAFVGNPAMWPVLLATGGTEVMPALANYLISAGFSVDMAREAIKSAPDIGAKWDTMDEKQKAEAVANLVVQSGMAAGIGAKVAKETPSMTTEPATQAVRKFGESYEAARKNAGPIGATIGGITGLAKGGPVGGYFGMKGGHYGGKLLSELAPSGEGLANLGKSDEEINVSSLEKELENEQKKAEPIFKRYATFEAGRQRGIPAPDDVLKAYEKAKGNIQTLQDHLNAAREAVESAKAPATPDQAITPEAVEAARPEAPSPTDEQINARQAALMKQMEEKVGVEKPTASSKMNVQPETFPQEPTAAPRVEETTRPRMLAGPEGQQGVIQGRAPRMLTEGTPEAVEAPKGEVLPPERPAMGKPGKVTGMRVGEGGQVVDTETPLERSIREGLEGSKEARPMAVKPAEEPLAKYAPEALAKREAAPVEAPKTAEAPKTEPGLMGTEKELKNEGRTPEDVSKVTQAVNAHTDQELTRLGKQYGLDESQYDFSARDEKRHRVERDQFVKDLVAKMPDKDIDGIARQYERFDKGELGDISKLSPAQRARAIMQEHTGLTGKAVAGGAPDEIVGRKEETVDVRAQVGMHNANGGSTFHPEHGDLKGKPYFAVGGEPEFRAPELKMTVPGGELTAEQIKEFTERPEVKATLAKHPDASVGTWHDQAADKTVVELVKTPADRAEAIKMGTENGEKAIYDLKEGKEIPTGGTGEGPKGGNITLHHWSGVDGLTETDPEKFGTNRAGAEKERSKEEGFLPRTYFGDAAYKEPAITSQKNHYTAEVDPEKYYDIAKDPDGIWQKAYKEGGATAAENAVHDAGYHGYFHDGGYVSFEKVPVKSFEEPKESAKEAYFRSVRTSGEATNAPYAKTGSGDWHDITEKPAKAYKDMTPEEQEALAAKGQAGGSSKVDLMYNRAMAPKLTRKYASGTDPQVKADLIYNRAEHEAPLEERVKAYKNMTSAEQEALAAKGQSGGSGAAAKPAPEGEPKPELGELAEKHGTAEEKEGIAKSAKSVERFVDNMEKIPEVHEYRDIALAGEGARKWYQRSTQAFDAMKEEAPEYFKEPADKEKFINLLAASSPRQSVAMNLRETLRTWKAYNDAGRPTGEALKELLTENLTPATSKVPNALKAINGEEMWPDITKNKNFKVPSFARNLRGWLGAVTNDGWMSLFAGLDPREISSAHSYHPLSIATRAAAEELGWEPAEAQAAIWSFTQALTERGEELPEEVRKHSEDFVDLLAHDPQVRDLLADLGVTHANLDAKLAAIGEKPEVSGRETSTTSRSIGRLKDRIETARGKGTIPPPKSAQGELGFREAPAHESRNNRQDEDVEFNPDEFGKNEEPVTPKGTEGHTYEYEKTADAHQVTVRDKDGNSVATISARAEEDNPNTWTVKASMSAEKGEGLKGYARLAEAAKAQAERSGKPVILQGDTQMSSAAVRTWVKLGEQRDYDVQWSKDNRPHITFRPSKIEPKSTSKMKS